MNTRFTILAIACTFVLLSCKKDEPDAPSNGGGGTPAATEADAHLTAVIYTNGLTSNFAFASFKGSNGQLVYVGDVILNYTQLDTSNANYFDNPSISSPLDLSNGETNWTVAGGNGFAAFSSNGGNTPFPFVGSITSSTTIDKSVGCVIECDALTNADSVEYSISDQNEFVSKVLPGNLAQCTFSPNELSVFQATSNASVSIYAYSRRDEIISGKRIRFQRDYLTAITVQIVD